MVSVSRRIKPSHSFLLGKAQTKARVGHRSCINTHLIYEEVKTKLRYDLYYVKNRDIFLDVNIVFKTIEAIFWKRGAA